MLPPQPIAPRPKHTSTRKAHAIQYGFVKERKRYESKYSQYDKLFDLCFEYSQRLIREKKAKEGHQQREELKKKIDDDLNKAEEIKTYWHGLGFKGSYPAHKGMFEDLLVQHDVTRENLSRLAQDSVTSAKSQAEMLDKPYYVRSDIDQVDHVYPLSSIPFLQEKEPMSVVIKSGEEYEHQNKGWSPTSKSGRTKVGKLKRQKLAGKKISKNKRR
eukprot:TRINITY_DN7945_c0_g1_i4.p1 TRINITY_DN7945_c0_g1~~TRINITY_DN7945_c0_g1_i4.p1  ORF type:complete len:229 (-),score=69.42 TRINITY_DN7945_c0_g1_i4:60-704(-)